MKFRFLHTSDWQVGKVFRFADSETMGLLQVARVDAITKLGEIARERELTHILVAGDVYDFENVSTRVLNQPMERMRTFEKIEWHLLPGNHDYQRANGIWDQLVHSGLPANVTVHREAEPVCLENYSVAILPAPLFHRRSLRDPTEYMKHVDLPLAYTKIGLVHGSVRQFGTHQESTANYIDVAGIEPYLSYLALGDWHGQQQISPKCWYSGTPEVDAFRTVNGGKALAVEIASIDAQPAVTSVECGKYQWLKFEEEVNDRNDMAILEEKLRSLSNRLDRILIRLKVKGILSLEEKVHFDTNIVEKLDAAFCYLNLDQKDLSTKPTPEDLNQIDIGGFVRKAVDKLRRISEEGSESEREIALLALQKLYVEQKRLESQA